MNRVTRAIGVLGVLFPGFCLAQAPATADDIAKLRDQIAAQQKQLNAQQQALDSLAGTAKMVESDAVGKPISPLAFHIGGADFTPSGFMDMSTVWRSADIGSGVATSFAGVPFSNTAAGRMPEFRSSAANSRLALTITENPTKNLAVTAYVEGDFYGNQPTSLYVTSNSGTLRLRHFWVTLQRGKWEVLGGQTWTLMTPNRSGTSQVSSNVFVGLGEDSNYVQG